MEQFKDLYEQKIIPVLKKTAGCRYAYLTEDANNTDEAISVTIWDTKESALEYETNGTFDSLLREAKHLLNELTNGKCR